MPKRNLRIVKQTFKVTLGVCEACNSQFTSHLPKPDQSQWEIQTQFDRHKCKPEDASQAAARIVREATKQP
jgi:hypothetical protein